MNMVLERFKEYSSKTKKHTCSNDFEKYGIKTLPTSYALNYAYISTSDYETKYIVLDIDRATSITQLVKDYAMPEPTIATFNREKRTAHIFYELKDSVSHHQNSRKKPQKLLEIVEQDLIIASDADNQFPGKHVKNPLSKYWAVETIDKQYELKDFLSINPAINRIYQDITRRTTQQEEGRNCYIFEKVRFSAYRAVHSYSSQSDFHKYIFQECLLANQEASQYFNKPLLPSKEIQTISKSISSWTWKNRDKIDGKNRGACNLIPIEELNLEAEEQQEEIRNRQRCGASYTARLKAGKTLDLIRNAVKSSNVRLTQKQVAEATKLSIETIKRNWKYI